MKLGTARIVVQFEMDTYAEPRYYSTQYGEVNFSEKIDDAEIMPYRIAVQVAAFFPHTYIAYVNGARSK
jgi:hypothetical protein